MQKTLQMNIKCQKNEFKFHIDIHKKRSIIFVYFIFGVCYEKN